MRIRDVSKARGVVDLRDWAQLDVTGGNDMASIFNAAMTQAAAANMPVTGPAGRYLIGSTVTQLAPLIGPAWGRSLTMPHMWLDSAISNGTPVLKNVDPTAIEGLYLRNVSIRSGQSDPASAENAIGIQWGDTSDVTPTLQRATRNRMENVWVSGFYTGVDCKGWYNDFDLWVVACQVGAKLSYQNGSVAKLRFENCNKDFAFTASSNFTVLSMSSEGPYRTAAATIDDCGDIALLNWRCESPNDNESVPWLSVGATTLVRNLLVRGQLEAADFGVYAIAYDNYEGPLPQVRFRTGTNRRAYSYTANTKFSDVRAPDVDFGYPFAPTNLDHTVKPAQNLLPNPRMEGLRWGCYNAVTAATSGTIALTSETTIVRDGASALKIASATAGTFQRAELRYNDPWCQTYRSKSVTLAGWVYIPNLASMDASDGAAPTYPVQLEIRSYDSVTGETSIASSSSNRQIANGWNFIHCTGTLHSLTDEVRIRVWVNNSSTATTGSSTEYVVVDSLYLCPGDVWRDIYEGRVVQSPLAAGDVIGGRLVVRMTSSAATTLIADTTQTFQVGDTIHYTDAASGGVPGIYCTTGGAGGTAVFRNMAALA